MTLTRTGYNKKGTQVFYGGAARSLRFDIGAFPDKTAPDTIEVADGVFAVKVAKTPRAKLTAEERKALPRPTLAERVAKAERRTADLRAKLAKETSVEQPTA